jgi:hypothetical protein
MQQMMNNSQQNMSEDLFAERFVKVTFRDFTNNTRMDIKNVDLKKGAVKRDRAMRYWQNNVIQNFLPPIDMKKKNEVDARREVNTPKLPPKKISQRIGSGSQEGDFYGSPCRLQSDMDDSPIVERIDQE